MNWNVTCVYSFVFCKMCLIQHIYLVVLVSTHWLKVVVVFFTHFRCQSTTDDIFYVKTTVLNTRGTHVPSFIRSVALLEVNVENKKRILKNRGFIYCRRFGSRPFVNAGLMFISWSIFCFIKTRNSLFIHVYSWYVQNYLSNYLRLWNWELNRES